ncbi:unnamed protein product, partial [Arabidopsis halleri]
MDKNMEEMFEDQNRRMAKHMAEMFEAFRLQKMGPNHSDLDQSDVRSSFSPGNHSGGSDLQREYRSGAPSRYAGLTRLGKIDFPKFDGKRVKEWLFKAEEFFGVDFTPAELKVKMAAIHFEGCAATWHQSFIQSGVGLEVLYDWQGYAKLLKERFEDVCDDPIAELKKLQEDDGGIVPYHEKFELIKTRVNLSEAYLVSAYLAGLRTDTQMHVRMFQPQTISRCLLLGRLYEKA